MTLAHLLPLQSAFHGESMLDVIRSNAQSFWVKVAFAIIILVFVFWGVGSFTDSGFVNVIGTVNNEPITYQQFEEAYREAEYSITQNQRGVKLTSEQKTQLGREVFQRLVTKQLISQEAKRVGLGVSPYELRMYVGSMEMFQDEKGRFNPETYKNILQARRQSAAVFEADLARRIMQDRMVIYLTASGWMDPDEPRKRFNFLRQSRVVDYVFISADSELSASAMPDDAAVAAYYEEHKTNYIIPQKADVQYIVVDPFKSVSPDTISDEEARSWYEKNKDSFFEPESVNVSHILVPLQSDASEALIQTAMERAQQIRKEILDGRPFDEAADAYNGPSAADSGGSLGWITPGMTVPEFEKAAFAAEKNVVTEPVRSQFGLHLILVNDTKKATLKTFEEVQGEIKANLAGLAGRAGLSDLLDDLTEDNILGRDLNEVASKRGLSCQTTGLLSSVELQQKLGITPDGASAIMMSAPNQPVDTPLEAGENYLIVRVVATSPSSFQPLDDVREDIIKRFRTHEGLGKARSLLEETLKKGPDAIPAEWIKESAPVERGGSLENFKPQANLDEAIFKAETGTWQNTVYSVVDDKGEGALIFRVKRVVDAPESEWPQLEQIMTELAASERSQGLIQEFLRQLFDKSKVEIRNQDIIDRKNM